MCERLWYTWAFDLFVYIGFRQVPLDVDDFESLIEKYNNAPIEEKIRTDSILKPLEDSLKAMQVKNVCGIAFGTSYENVDAFCRHKFGTPDYFGTDRTKIYFNNINYAGIDFSALFSLFQSDGVNSYLNSCIFVKKVKSLSEAIETQRISVENILKKYEMKKVPVTDGFPVYVGGLSPLWDGHWYNLSDKCFVGIHTDIIKYDINVAKNLDFHYGVRIIYGPYDYVKEEF